MQRSYIWPLLIALAIFGVSSAPQFTSSEFNFYVYQDKIIHILVFGLLATSILRCPRFRSSGWRGALVAALLTSAYGICDEFRQSFSPGRSVAMADWVADTIGAFIAVTVYLQWHGYRKLLEWHPRIRTSPKN
jgi:VanZ family protein